MRALHGRVLRLLCLLLILSAPSWQCLAAPADLLQISVYRQLLMDLATEAQQFQSSKLSAQDVQAFQRQWSSFVNGESAQNPTESSGLPWSGIWPPEPLPAAQPVSVASLQDVKSPPIAPGDPHSLAGVDKYLADRLGAAIFKLAKSGTINVEVFAGDLASLAADPTHPSQNLVRIPSLYEKWGIYKCLDLASVASGKPRVVFSIPPITQYATHYAAMLKLTTGHDATVRLNNDDRDRLRFTFEKAVSILWRRLPRAPEHVVFGYGPKWEQMLTGGTSEHWELTETPKHVVTNAGVSGKLFTVRSKSNRELVVDILSVESDLTLWGEATAFLVEAVARRHPGSIFFLGSAGAPSEMGKVYDISAPDEFYLNGKQISIDNALNKTAVDLKKNLETKYKGVNVITEASHGNSNSPAEQTLAVVSGFVAAGLNTVDVEQSLVADTIARYNARSPIKINFGAVNLITDKPSNLENKWDAGNDLDHVDQTRKDLARTAIVDLLLGSIDAMDANDGALLSGCHKTAKRAGRF